VRALATAARTPIVTALAHPNYAGAAVEGPDDDGPAVERDRAGPETRHDEYRTSGMAHITDAGAERLPDLNTDGGRSVPALPVLHRSRRQPATSKKCGQWALGNRQ